MEKNIQLKKALFRSRPHIAAISRTRQMSESLELGLLLAAAGGFMDAYSYICREHVFANAQTGNMLLIGIYLFEKNWGLALRYLFPVVSFTSGIALADLIRIKFRRGKAVHWRQNAVFAEAAILLAVGCIPKAGNLTANCLTSLACGIQVESFRKIHGSDIATTMCIGNLRSAAHYLGEYMHTGARRSAAAGLLYSGIIVSFVLGAVAGNLAVSFMGIRAIWTCEVILAAIFLLMYIDREKDRRA